MIAPEPGTYAAVWRALRQAAGYGLAAILAVLMLLVAIVAWLAHLVRDAGGFMAQAARDDAGAPGVPPDDIQ